MPLGRVAKSWVSSERRGVISDLNKEDAATRDFAEAWERIEPLLPRRRGDGGGQSSVKRKNRPVDTDAADALAPGNGDTSTTT